MMQHYKTLADLHRANGYPLPENPLLSLLNCNHSSSCSIGTSAFTGDFYMIGFKKLKSGIFRYGRTRYDHDNGVLSFIKPRQVIELKNIELEEAGFLMFIHEDFLNAHGLHTEIKKYGYFEYETNEALHLSPREEQIIWDLYRKIEIEYRNNPDEYSREIILTHVDSILKYAQRFYKRQFIDRKGVSGKIVSKFNDALAIYAENGTFQNKGLPTVRFIAAELNVSPRYLSDLLKQETGKTAIELIHIFLIAEAKHLLSGPDNTVSSIAYSLGFENPPYFSRLFKKEVGITPVEFKRQHLN